MSIVAPQEFEAFRFFSAVIVATNSVMREGLASILSRASYRIAATASSIEEVLSCLPQEEQPSVFIFSINPEAEDCVTIVRGVTQRFPKSKIAFLVNYISGAKLGQLLRAGAHGCILDPELSETLVKCIDLIIMGQSVIPLEVASSLRIAIDGPVELHADTASSVNDKLLSDRELQIVRCLVAGYSNKGIARRFAISEATVKVHMKAILRKLRARNRTQVAIWAVDHGIAVHEDDQETGKAVFQFDDL